jgi:hypothetical protein
VETTPIANVTDFSTASTIRIFPNPSEGTLSFTIPSAMQNAKVKIYSIDGKIVFSEERNLETTSTYNLKHLNGGLYFVSISDGKHTATAKWLKN